MLSAVYFDGGYSGVVLNKAIQNVAPIDKPIITKIFYGVLSKDSYLKYAISWLCKNNPKPKIALIMKIALYQLYFTSQQPYVVISSAVELVKDIGKHQVSGFVNAVLKKYNTVVFPQKSDKITYLSVYGSVPEWIAKKLIKQLGFDFALEMLTANLPEKTHIRHNPSVISYEQLKSKLSDSAESGYGFYVDGEVLSALNKNEFTAQSVSSIRAVECYVKNKTEGAVLDLCAAPGGKSVLIAQSGNFSVTSCDLHEHRVELIRSYADRMGVKLTAMQNDATKLRKEWQNAFDIVVCDVPCSGIGVIHSKPDILLNRQEKDVPELASVQSEILSVASSYVKEGGRLCYSTCTVLYEENERVIERFLKNNENYELDFDCIDGGMLNIYPHKDGCDGFFVASLRRVK